MSERLGPREASDYARRIEAMGYHGLLVPEAVHDGFLMSMAALSATQNLQVATSVLVAFPRSPMTTAHAAWDLQALSNGRFELGLGTQVPANIVGRFSTSWASPVSRMREYIESLKAIFECFQSGERLDYEGQHYRFTRLQPFFNPGPLDCGPPPIQIGAVGPQMTRMAGAAADGLISHPTNSSARALTEITLPRVVEGARSCDRIPRECRVTAAGFVATGIDTAAVNARREWIRRHLAFLYSTPAYWPSLDLFGYAETGRALYDLSKRGAWDEMTAWVNDEMIDALVPQGCYAEIAGILRDQYASIVDRITFPVPDDPNEDGAVSEVIASLSES